MSITYTERTAIETDPESGVGSVVGTSVFDGALGDYAVVLRVKRLGSSDRCFYEIFHGGADFGDGNCSSRSAAEAAVLAELS